MEDTPLHCASEHFSNCFSPREANVLSEPTDLKS